MVGEHYRHFLVRTFHQRHCQNFLPIYIREHREALRHAQYKNSAFGFPATLEKARFGNEGVCDHPKGMKDRLLLLPCHNRVFEGNRKVIGFLPWMATSHKRYDFLTA